MIRVALIGTGSISGVHLRYLKSRDDVEIAALCDIKADNLKRRQDEFGGQGFAEFEAMLDAAKPDAVWLCTPTGVRRDPLVACAERGLPVLCEKPVARTVADGEAIAGELAKRKARVQVGYVFRSMPIVTRAVETMADDRIDLAQSFYGCPVGLTRTLPAWFYDKAQSGGALVDQATHNLDLLRMLVGEVAEVRGLASNPAAPKTKDYSVDEVISLSLLFDSGAAGSHVHTWIGDRWRNEVLLVGRKRAYRLDLGKGVLVVDEGGRRLIHKQDSWRMYEHENARFLEMVSSGDWSASPSDYEDGLKTLRLTLACDATIANGQAGNQAGRR